MSGMLQSMKHSVEHKIGMFHLRLSSIILGKNYKYLNLNMFDIQLYKANKCC